MKEVKAYICSYCDNVLAKDPNSVIEHEKRCLKNPNRKICSCVRCVHGEQRTYEEIDHFDNYITHHYAICAIGKKFEDSYLYCESFEERDVQNTRKTKAVNIIWDVDDEDIQLPTEIVIPDGMTDEEEISDYLSDLTGFCHKGFELV